MSSLHISLTAEKLFDLGEFLPVTNSLLTTWLVMLFLTLFCFFVTRKLTLVPKGFFQSFWEIVLEGLSALFQGILQEKTSIFFPLLATLFLFIISLNWAGLIPGVGTIGLWEGKEGHKVFVPLFRAGTADLNTTLALAAFSVLTIQYFGVKTLGKEYLKRFLNLTNPIYFFVGILELISEFSKIVSFAFRLFGNIFAGEVLLTVIAFLIPLFAPLPFLGLELFVGFIQALVFSMLTAVFLSVATTKAEH